MKDAAQCHYKWGQVYTGDFPARLGLRRLWLAQILGQAKAVTQGLALAWPGLGRGLCMWVDPVDSELIYEIPSSPLTEVDNNE